MSQCKTTLITTRTSHKTLTSKGIRKTLKSSNQLSSPIFLTPTLSTNGTSHKTINHKLLGRQLKSSNQLSCSINLTLYKNPQHHGDESQNTNITIIRKTIKVKQPAILFNQSHNVYQPSAPWGRATKHLHHQA